MMKNHTRSNAQPAAAACRPRALVGGAAARSRAAKIKPAPTRADRGRRAELLRRRRHAAGEGRREVVPVINKLAAALREHRGHAGLAHAGHASFASTHAGKKPFETTKLSYGTQVLWPDHCVQGTDDAALHKDLKLPTAQLIIRKGYPQGRRQLLGVRGGRPQDRDRAWPAT